MSRCFPFPPPGYEKKPRPDDADLLKKEKQKDKKHKKEKRDREKREGKEKREKDKSDGKHREKKDKKEKRKEKKDKDKNKEKDRKEKSSTSENKREAYNGQKLIQEESRVLGQFEGCNAEKKLHKKEEQIKGKISISDEKKPTFLQFPNENDGSNFLLELGKRSRDEEKGSGTQLVTDWRKDEGIERTAVKFSGMLFGSRDKGVGNSKMDEAKATGNAMLQNKVEMPRPMEKKIERRVEGKDKSKERESDDKQADKRKSKDREKQSQRKEKDGEKKAKKEEKAKEKSERKKTDKEKSERKKTEKEKGQDRNKNDLMGAPNIKTSHPPKDCNKNAAIEGNLKKRKESETNGFLHDNELRPNKVPRLDPPLSTDNGKKLEPQQTPIQLTSDRQGASNNLMSDKIGHKVNGTILAAQPVSVSQTKPSSSSTKPPHPDTKYLSKILSVPKMEDWSDCDEQDWLFSSKDSLSKKPNACPSGVNEEIRVWSEVLPIEAADISALPYVIPY